MVTLPAAMAAAVTRQSNMPGCFMELSPHPVEGEFSRPTRENRWVGKSARTATVTTDAPGSAYRFAPHVVDRAESSL
ncbi:hypothetical protein CLE01_17690 [Cryobacterium levicorallinum]|nr:hypothetical protein CLE01_17690 [Cryobacterium levicorallinum]